MVGLDVHISLTTTHFRVDEVHRTVESLLCQSVRPTSITLYLGDGPATKPLSDLGVDRTSTCALKLLQLGRHTGGVFRVRWVANMGPHTKLLPGLAEHRNDDVLLVTVDDDFEYHISWLLELLEGYLRSDRNSVVARRVRLIPLQCRSDAPCIPERIAPYVMNVPADSDVQDWAMLAPGRSEMLALPCGVGGVLYRPGFLHPIVHDEAFRAACPQADDISFRFASVLNGVRVFVSGGTICDGKPNCGLGEAHRARANGKATHRALTNGKPTLSSLNFGGQHGNDRGIEGTLAFLHDEARLISSATPKGLLGSSAVCKGCG